MAVLDNINYGSGQDPMQDVFDKINLAIDRINDYYGELQTVRVALGAWNMDTTSFILLTVPGLVDYNKIAYVSVYVYNDSQTEKTQIERGGFTVSDISNSKVVIARDTGGVFDNTDYNDAIINRGYAYVTIDQTL